MKRPLFTENACRGISAGGSPHKRALDRDAVLTRQAHWHAQPVSKDRTAALTAIRGQLRSIANRVEVKP